LKAQDITTVCKPGLIIRIILAMLVIMGLNMFFEINNVSAVQDFTIENVGAVEDKIYFTDGVKYYEYTLEELKLEKYQNYDRDSVFCDYTRCTDPTTLSYQLFCLTKKVDKSPVDARFYVDEEGNLQIQAEQTGWAVDLSLLITTLGNPGVYQQIYLLPLKKISPQVTAAELEQYRPAILWSEYTTQLADNPDRTENVRVASQQLNGLVVKPGEIVSFNTAIGPRVPERGYREAKIIVGGKFEDGVGGGVCQVSSTLYNAVLLAGLNIVERHNHSVQISYVPLGRDATVVYAQKDLAFRNETDCYLLFQTKLNGLALNISIYGSGQNIYDKVYLENRIIKTYLPSEIQVPDVSVPAGEKRIIQKGQKGYLVETSRILIIDEQERREILSRDYYEPVQTVLSINPREMITPIETQSENNQEALHN